MTDRGNCSWRLFNDLIDVLAEKNLGCDGGVEKTLGWQFVNTLSDVPASINQGGHGHALRGPGISAWRAPHVFFSGFWFFFAHMPSFLTFPLTLNNDINLDSPISCQTMAIPPSRILER